MKAFQLSSPTAPDAAVLILGNVGSGPEGSRYVVFVDVLLFTQDGAAPVARRLVWSFNRRGSLEGDGIFREKVAAKGAQAWAARRMGVSGSWIELKDPVGAARDQGIAACLAGSIDSESWAGIQKLFHWSNEEAALNEIEQLRGARFEEMAIP